MKIFPQLVAFVATSLLLACSPSKPAAESSSSPITPEPIVLATPAPEPVSYVPASTPPIAPVTATPAPWAAPEPPEAPAPVTITTAPAATAIPTPHPAKGATEAAMRAYPDLAKKDSMFNRAFRDLFDDKKKTDPAFLAKPDWPLNLGKETAALLSVANPTPVATTDKIAANTNPTKPTWFEELQKQPSALGKGAYDQRRVVYPRHYYYYTDSYGTFWIDRYGARHYY